MYFTTVSAFSSVVITYQISEIFSFFLTCYFQQFFSVIFRLYLFYYYKLLTVAEPIFPHIIGYCSYYLLPLVICSLHFSKLSTFYIYCMDKLKIFTFVHFISLIIALLQSSVWFTCKKIKHRTFP